MNPDHAAPGSSSLERQSSHGYASSAESDAKRPGGSSSSSGKKRASRAGTRSVTTLSTAQLERKRANDREAQRAIRQRTKDHIEGLELAVSELRGSQESHERLVAATAQRNRELEAENVFLRTKLGDGGYGGGAGLTRGVEGNRHSDAGLLTVQATSPTTQPAAPGSGIPRPGSTSTVRSLSVTTASSRSRHGSFQQQQQQQQHSGLLPAAPGSAVMASEPSVMTGSMPLTTWRSQDGMAGLHGGSQARSYAAELSHAQMPAAYPTAHPGDRPEWAGPSPQYAYPAAPEHRRLQHYGQPPQAQVPAPQSTPIPQHYVPAALYPHTPPPPTPLSQQQALQPPQLPQAEFQGMAVSSPGYSVAHPQPQPQPQQHSVYRPHALQQHAAYPHTQPQQSPYPQPQPPYPQALPPPPSSQAYPPAAPKHMEAMPGVVDYHHHHPAPPLGGGHLQPQQPQYALQQQQQPPVHPPMQYRDDGRGRAYGLGQYSPG
ncbi:hypothetical protein LTR53_009451 [Teratosphaeriaceae sp. CCFEE 6253]|nr:hypothetical protein LTR53_009451 [Teratosphaeriaceae sp. CCFEE 6253]